MAGFPQRPFPTKTTAPATPPPTQAPATTAKTGGYDRKNKGGTSGFKRVGAGWNSTSKDGTKEFIKIRLDDGSVLFVFINDNKAKETDPDYSVTLQEK
jgi:hypothetical protein